MRPYVWTIAGSDSSGGAGIQADLKTLHAFAVQAGTVITTITAQNCRAVEAVNYLSETIIQQQIDALAIELPPKVIKLGLLGNMRAVAQFLKKYSGPIICDPVMVASSGQPLLANLDDFMRLILPEVDILTPNIPEAEQLTGQIIQSYADMEIAAAKILDMGVSNVYLKGGHFAAPEWCCDYFTDGKEAFWLNQPRIATPHTHGTGCTLSAAIAACLALDYCLRDALVIARMYVQQGLRCAVGYGATIGAVAQLGFPNTEIDLPYLSDRPFSTKPRAYASCAKPIGLYPVVDSSNWVLRVAKHGVSSVQLRIKSKSLLEVEREIILAIAIAEQYQCRLFINDYWQLAIRHGAYGVHLGQEDLQTADLGAIHQAGLRLGISTHCFYEVARAHGLNPSYMACGPIFATHSKIMPFSPQRLAQLQYWRQLLAYPLVAIGGINLSNISAVINTGVDGVALISAITQSENPERAVENLLLSSLPIVVPNTVRDLDDSC